MAAKKKKNRAPGIVAKLNAAFRGLKIGLPAISSFTVGLSLGDAATVAATRYSGFDLGTMEFTQEGITPTAGFYAGNLVERKALNALRIPQMAGQKKILSVVAQYLPEIQAGADLAQGVPAESVGKTYGQRAIGYDMRNHVSWIESPATRDIFLKNLFARIGMGLISRFIGPMINKHLPKGVGI